MGLFLVINLAILISFCSVSCETNVQETQTFIIRVQHDLKPSQFSTLEEWYTSTLKRLQPKNPIPFQPANSTDNILHVYKTVFYGFSATLTRDHARELETRPEILGVFPDNIRKIQTTRTPHFLGLDTGKAFYCLLNESDYGSDVIIGLLDTGIWPEHPSFNDKDMDPVPARWKGECQEGEQFPKTTCNKKLIGARYFSAGYERSISQGIKNGGFKSARDSIGHGTHTASTAAGLVVKNASCLGFASGQASGVAPKARIAVYKVCWSEECSESDILAGFDSAVKDGVDILSVSLGGDGPYPYWEDVLAIGAFGAMERGVLVSASAGNSGPKSGLVTNIAPWVTTVGAGTLDRTFPADLSLGDGTVIIGSSLYNGTRLSNLYPLIYAGNVSSSGVSTCLSGSLDAGRVHGKIVVCDKGDNGPVEKGLVVRDAGGVGVVAANVIDEDLLAYPYLIPGLAITMSARKKLFEYLTTNPNPQATMAFRGTQIGVKPAPVVAGFSSRGPNILSMNVLKPDLIAPGVDILAAWPNNISISKLLEDPRRTEFNILPGTSMSCPHVSGIAALLKGVHRDWLPAMKKSALMTTAYTHDHDGKPLLDNKDLNVSDPWSMGAGHVDPMKAVDPGLVYNITVDDYIEFLCASGLTSKQIKAVTKRAVECSKVKKSNPWDLNYPAISVVFNTSKPSNSEVVVTRTVTNVIDVASTYTVVVSNPKGVIVTVDPQHLVFGKIGEQKSYVVKISAKNVVIRPGKMLSHFGQLSWKDGSHKVTSPIVVTWI